jgi:hypothetical protein
MSAREFMMARRELLLLALAVTFANTCVCVGAADANRIGLQDTLRSMHVKESAAVCSTMQSLGLELDEDFVILNDAEQELMMAGLEAAGISLGDRSKVRHRFGALLQDLQRVQISSPEAASLRQPELKMSPDQRLPLQYRQLQQQSGGSLASITLAVTALLGIASYLVQAKISRDAERSQTESDVIRG